MQLLWGILIVITYNIKIEGQDIMVEI